MAILESKEKALQSRKVRLAKVLWEHHSQIEATWEMEEEV